MTWELPPVICMIEEHLVPSLSLQLRNQGQEAAQDLTMVALPRNFVTKLGLELGQKLES